ncbi:hypothetical protein [Bosea sp. BK604]|uniref:hypothetical protein n=1 Tax=Bosea sp. BK604 TaxID=2512180 RepID=UPI00104FC583|nr:hypothetical protein [Bosea sp. BK604]TCR65438.1 hypothetical protein EV560_105201 [Bosea sp. BK604]
MAAGTASRNIGIWGYDQAQDASNRVAELLGNTQTNALNALGTGRTNSLAALEQGYAAAAPQYQAAIERLDPYAQSGLRALGTYEDSLGLNGQAGYDSTVNAYRASPGYQRRVDEATDAVARKASALGALGSGNTMQAISDRANALADEDYGRWQGQVQGLAGMGQQTAATQSGIQQNLGNLLAQQGRDVSNVWGTTAGQESGLYQNLAGLGANNIWNAANAGLSAVQTGQKNAADAVASRNSMTTNIIGSGLSLLTLGMGSPLAAGLMAGGTAAAAKR